MKKPKEILILGYGQEGKWWVRFFTKLKIPTKTYKDPEDAWWYVPNAEVILIAVPLSEILHVGDRLVRLVRKDALLISVCGLMEDFEKKLASFEGEILFLHRLIGAHVESMKGHSLVVNKIRLTNFHDWCDMLIRESEATLVPSASFDHDDTMGLVQALIRVVTLSYGILSAEAKLPLQGFTNGPLLGLMSIIARILDVGQALGADMVFLNQHTHKWTHRFADLIIDLSHDRPFYEEVQRKLAAYFGEERIKAGSKALASIALW